MKNGKNGKNPVKNPVATREGRNGGTLRSGGTNKGGPGRPTSAIREACAKSFDERIRILEIIADDSNSADGDRIRALDLLGKYGALQKMDVGHSVIDNILDELDRLPDDPE